MTTVGKSQSSIVQNQFGHNLANEGTSTPATQTQHKIQNHVGEQIHATMDRMQKLVENNMTFSNSLLKVSSFNDILPQKAQKSVDIQDAANLVRAKIEEVNIRTNELNTKNIAKIFDSANASVDSQVKQYVEAQNKLRNALSYYMEVSGIDTNKHIRMCDNKIAATLNFVGTMMQEVASGNSLENLSKHSFTENVNKQELHMHGTQFLPTKMQDTLKGIYDKLAVLESPEPQGVHQKYHSHIKEIARDLQKLQESVTALKSDAEHVNENAHAASDTPKLVYDAKMLQAMELSLSTAKQRLESIKNIKPFQNYISVVNGLKESYRCPTSEEIDILKVNGFSETQINTVKNYINFTKNAFEALTEGRLPLRTLDGVIEKLMLLRGKNDELFFNVRNDASMLLLHGENKVSEEHSKVNKDYLSVLKQIKNSLNPHLIREFVSLREILINANKPLKTRELIVEAVKGSRDLNTLVEARMRGVSTKNLAEYAMDSHLKKADPLGHGAINEVFLCKYSAGDGGEVEYVFKGEHGGKRGFLESVAGNSGYASSVYLSSLNVASYEAAEMIGCQDAIAKSNMGCLNGQWGLFMEHAKGKVVDKIQSTGGAQEAEPVLHVNGTDYSLSKLHEVLTKEQQKTMLASLLNELTKLEWADALTGQMDRHQGNYLFHLDPVTFKAKITGIDNDACYNSRMVGLAKMRVGELVESVEDDDILSVTTIDQNPTTYTVKYEVKDCTTIPTDNVSFFAKKEGLNQMFKPLFITPQIFQSIQNFSEEKYVALLKERIGATEIDAALSRFRELKEHALALQKDSKTFIQDGDWKMTQFLENVSETMEKQNSLSQIQKNFISRDFFDLKPMIDGLIDKGTESS